MTGAGFEIFFQTPPNIFDKIRLMNQEKIITFKKIEIRVRYKKIKNIILKIKKDNQVDLSVPIKIREEEILKFLTEKESWIEKVISKNSKNQTEGFYFLGQKYLVNHIHTDNRKPIFELSSNIFYIKVHSGIPEKTKYRYLEKHFEHTLLEITKEFFEKWERELGVVKKELIIKKMKGKWGWCNTKNGDICLNLELVRKDIKFIEYVVLHELCHILVPNHGPLFKKLLNTHMPDWKRIVKEFST